MAVLRFRFFRLVVWESPSLKFAPFAGSWQLLKTSTDSLDFEIIRADGGCLDQLYRILHEESIISSQRLLRHEARN